MTPQERKLVDELFERLAMLETCPREPDAEQAIMSGLRKAPNATYALVQTVLLQDEALRNADERIRELEGGDAYAPQQQGGFLDSMRDAVFGSRPRTSVPPTGGSDRPMGVPSGFRAGSGYPPNDAYAQAPQPPQASAGGSFLGTAAAAAVGVIGGSMLMNSMRGMLGSGHPASGSTQSAADLSGNNASPWGGSGDASSSDLAKQAGLDNMGQSSGSGNRAGLFDQPSGRDEPAAEEPYDVADGGFGDDGGLDLGDFDFG